MYLSIWTRNLLLQFCSASFATFTLFISITITLRYVLKMWRPFIQLLCGMLANDVFHVTSQPLFGKQYPIAAKTLDEYTIDSKLVEDDKYTSELLTQDSKSTPVKDGRGELLEIPFDETTGCFQTITLRIPFAFDETIGVFKANSCLDFTLGEDGQVLYHGYSHFRGCAGSHEKAERSNCLQNTSSKGDCCNEIGRRHSSKHKGGNLKRGFKRVMREHFFSWLSRPLSNQDIQQVKYGQPLLLENWLIFAVTT